LILQKKKGLMKMMTIGLGKQYGASVCHRSGYKNMARLTCSLLYLYHSNMTLQMCDIIFYYFCAIVLITLVKLSC